MLKETPELIAESWQILVEYIPRKEHSAAAEQFCNYLVTALSEEEMIAIADLDSDLSEAYVTISRDNEEFEEEFHEDFDDNE
jgi:hypothetical protein